MTTRLYAAITIIIKLNLQCEFLHLSYSLDLIATKYYFFKYPNHSKYLEMKITIKSAFKGFL